MNRKIWIPAALALAVAIASVGGSACFTDQVMSSVQGRVVTETPAMRVRHTYIDGKGRMVVMAEGGVWQENRSLTPRAPVWFEVDITKLAPKDRGQIVIPQSALKSGTPDLAQLAQDGFIEIPFSEDAADHPRNSPPTPPTPTPPETSYVKVSYAAGLGNAQEFPEKLGYDPRFAVEKNPAMPDNQVQILDEKRDSHPAAIILLPVAVAADIVTFPFLVILVISMNGH